MCPWIGSCTHLRKQFESHSKHLVCVMALLVRRLNTIVWRRTLISPAGSSMSFIYRWRLLHWRLGAFCLQRHNLVINIGFHRFSNWCINSCFYACFKWQLSTPQTIKRFLITVIITEVIITWGRNIMALVIQKSNLSEFRHPEGMSIPVAQGLLNWGFNVLWLSYRPSWLNKTITHFITKMARDYKLIILTGL